VELGRSPKGGALVAFTDGLIERRGREIDLGLSELTGRLTSPPGETADTSL
jgi:hypothetical protein